MKKLKLRLIALSITCFGYSTLAVAIGGPLGHFFFSGGAGFVKQFSEGTVYTALDYSANTDTDTFTSTQRHPIGNSKSIDPPL